MKNSITHYSLKWSLDDSEGQIILEMKDEEGNVSEKKINGLQPPKFNALAIILMKGKAQFDTNTNIISNIAKTE